MRKHFLILFLMALLPLAGWSANFNTEGRAVVDDIPYGSNVTIANIHFTLNGIAQPSAGGEGFTPIFKWEGKYYTDKAATVELEGNPQCGETYYIRVIPNNTETVINNGYTIAEVLFVKADLTVTIKGADSYFIKDFKDIDPTIPAAPVLKKEGDKEPTEYQATVAGLKYDDTIADVLTWSNVTYEYPSDQANAKSDGTWFKDDKGKDITTNKITFKGFTLTAAGEKNYNLKFADTYMKIRQIALTADNFSTTAKKGKFTVTRDASYNAKEKLTYTGVAQNVKYSVKYYYGDGKDDFYELQEKDLTIKYNDGQEGSEPAADAIDAYTYSPVLFAEAKGNFSWTTTGIEPKVTEGGTSSVPEDLKFEIQRANLFVLLNADKKTYDGKQFLEAGETTTPSFNFSSLLGKDAGKTVAGLTVKANTNTTLSANVGSYSMIPDESSFANAEINFPAVGDVNAYTVKLTKNYNCVPAPAIWKIEEKTLTVTAKAVKTVEGQEVDVEFITYGEAVPNLKITADGALKNESDKVVACYKATTVAADKLVVGANKITVALKPASDYTGDNATAQQKAKENAEKVLNNYKIKLNDGTLIVKGVGFTIMPNVSASVEYGTAPVLSYSAFNSTTLTSITAAHTPTYLFRKAGEDATAATATVPTAVGNYIVSIDEDATLAPTIGYDGSMINYKETPFTIAPKKLELTVANQTVIKNDDKAVFLNMLANAEDSWSLAEGQTTAYGETLSVEFSLNEFVAASGATPASGNVVVTKGKIISIATRDGLNLDANGYIPDAIYVKLVGETAGNYDITGYTKGKLKIETTMAVDLAAATAENTIAAAAGNGGKYNVTISGRKLNGGVWNALVLPFDVEAFDFCNAIGGYAVFNTLKSAENGNVKFGLYTGTLKAGEPFLVKPNENVDFDAFTYTDSNNNGELDENEENSVTKTKFFSSVIFDSKTPTLTVDGVEFIGNYAATPTLTGGEGIMALQKQDDNSYKFVDVPAAVVDAPFVFMGAYLNTNTNNARVFVEEADGTVTAISTIAADGVAVPAEGWYTLNGVKLQAAPTAKGVYINNGKKVVIK